MNMVNADELFDQSLKLGQVERLRLAHPGGLGSGME
jgi:hypothetical protein